VFALMAGYPDGSRHGTMTAMAAAEETQVDVAHEHQRPIHAGTAAFAADHHL